MTATARRVPLDILDHIRVASPCPMKWDQLTPIDGEGDRARHCESCGLNVFNFAELTREEAADLLERHTADGRRLCGALFRRADGTLITRDCPVGLSAAKARARAVLCRILSLGLLGLSGAIAYASSVGAGRAAELRMFEPARTTANWLHDQADRLLGRNQNRNIIMGEICPPAPRNGLTSTGPASQPM